MPIYDTSYRHIEGVRSVSRIRFLPIVTTGARLFLKKRGAKWVLLLAALPLFFGIVALILPGIMTSGEGTKFMQSLKPFLDISGAYLFALIAKFEWVPMFLITLFAGAGLVANDLRANASEIYFSRPVTRLDYVLGKLGVLELLLLSVTFLPGALLWLLDVLLDDKSGYLFAQLYLLPRLLAASLILTVPKALLMLAISSIARTARNAMLVFAGLVLMSKATGAGLAENLEEARYAAVSLDSDLERLASAALSADLDTFSGFGLRLELANAPLGIPIAVVAGVVAISALVLMRRVRAVEVVAA